MVKQYSAHNSLTPIYLSWQIDPDSEHYNLCFSYQLKNKEEAELLVTKLQELIHLKAYLRQTFTFEDGTLIATIHDTLPAKVNHVNTSFAKLPELEEHLIKCSHDLNRQSAIQLTIVHLDDCQSCLALFNIQHMIIDGASLDNFIMDLNSLLRNEQPAPELADDHIVSVMQEPSLEDIHALSNADQYIDQLHKLMDEINLSAHVGKENVHYTEVLQEDISQKLYQFSQRHSISVFNLLLLAQGIFFAKLFNQDFSLTNYPVNVRNNKSINGCFLNLVVFPLTYKNEDSYLSLINTHQNQLSFFKSITKGQLNIPNIASIPSFANSNFAQLPDLIIGNKNYVAKNYIQLASSTLSIKYRERSNQLHFSCDVKQGLLPDYLANSLLLRFFKYLNQLLDNPVAPIITTDLTFDDEKHKLLNDFNNTTRDYPDDKTIHQLFEEQVECLPNNIALEYNNTKWTYLELNQHANQLTHYLINHHQVKSNSIIALCLDTNPSLLIAMLATLKTGNAYVAFDAKLHANRMEYILRDTKTTIVLTNSHHHNRLTQLFQSLEHIEVVPIDSLEVTTQLNQQKTTNIITNATNQDLAHIIYTSGTTGSPKGVMIEHKNVVSLVKNVTYMQINEFDTFALFSDIAFDASTFEIWSALLNGAKLFIPYKRLDFLSNTVNLKNLIANHHATVLLLTKTLFDQLFYLDETIFSGLHYLLVGGESLNKSLIYKLATSQYKPINLINAYGPTENTTMSCVYNVSPEKIRNLSTVPVGTPLSNRTAYILDSHLNLLPIGAIGEIYVGGAGLARGYLNQADLTAKRFIPNPFETKDNNRLYKTGDLARMLPDGSIECLGRNDFQVKIRGYRIELSEIESKLLNHPKIKQAVVLQNKCFNTDEQADPYLIAYYVADSELSLRDYLMSLLPEYMLPKGFIHLTELPRTASGKLNREKLPAPSLLHNKKHIKPKNEAEKLIVDAFSEVLGVKQVSVNDDFFYIGGNSIKALALTSILQAKFKVTVADIFNKKTPEHLAKDIVFSNNDLKSQIEKIKSFFKEIKQPDYVVKDQKESSESYLRSVPESNVVFTKKNIASVLLTGATGYLGCNLLYQLLERTDYKIFLLVRSSSNERAFSRVNRKFQFYFDKTLQDVYGSRLFVFSSDLEQSRLGLSEEDYQFLSHNVDSIIHSAALTKHYGEYDKFYSANVQATVNLLELSLLTPSKDFHHISTISVLHYSDDDKEYLTEDDIAKHIDEQSNIYIKTKYEAEKQVIQYRQQGVRANIYRIGNLAFILANYRTQENIEDNAFFSRMKCLVTLKVIAHEIGMEDISPVDLTAQAIMKILDKQELQNATYHVYNPNACNVSEFLSQIEALDIKLSPINDFLDVLANHLDKPHIQNNLIIRFLLHQGWLEGEHRSQIVHYVLQNRTNAILERMGFKWPVITKKIFSEFIEKAYLHHL